MPELRIWDQNNRRQGNGGKAIRLMLPKRIRIRWEKWSEDLDTVPRVKGGPKGPKKHKKILKTTKGYRGTRSKLFRPAHEAYLHAGEYAFAGRKKRQRDFRRLWIQKINAALTPFNISYSHFIKRLKDQKIELDRKVLANIAVSDPKTFAKIVKEVKKPQLNLFPT